MTTSPRELTLLGHGRMLLIYLVILRYCFNSPKTVSFHEVINSTLVSPSHGTYTVSGHKLYLTYILENDTATVEYDYSVQGDKLMLYVEGQGPTTFTRVSDSVIEPYL